MTTRRRYNGPTLLSRGRPFVDYDGVPVTPADGADLPDGPCKGVVCTAGGNVSVQLTPAAGTAVLTALLAGVVYPMSVSRILATGTTATGVFALY